MNTITNPINIIDTNRQELTEIIRNTIESINANREEILTAFIAKYGYEPDEIEQVEETVGCEKRWYVRKRFE